MRITMTGYSEAPQWSDLTPEKICDELRVLTKRVRQMKAQQPSGIIIMAGEAAHATIRHTFPEDTETVKIKPCRYLKPEPLTAAIEYQYEPIAAQAMQIVSQYGSYEILETKLQAAVEERAKIVFARYGAMTLLENRATLSAQVQEEVKELEELFPVNFTQVVVKDIDFSDAFEQAVEAKMQAEQNALRAENEKQEAITRAEQEREVARVEAEAAVLAAEGEARALEITREALENMPDTWIAQQYLEKWDGKLPQFITGDGSGLMLTPNLEQ